jgi:hypothetical protein
LLRAAKVGITHMWSTEGTWATRTRARTHAS